MRFSCDVVGAEFLETAPWRFRASAELPVSADEAFEVLEDAASWPKWLRGVRHVEWTSPKPFGVGTTRTVKAAGAKFHEHFFRWEPGRRFTFYVLASEGPVRIFRALAEDYLLEPTAHGSVFTYSVALTPSRFLRAGGPLVKWLMRRAFEGAPRGLARYAAKRR